MGIAHWIVVAIAIAAAVGIMYVAMRQFGVEPPAWAVQIFWIVIVAVVAITAVRFVAGLGCAPTRINHGILYIVGAHPVRK